jgi:hypothetical protein
MLEVVVDTYRVHVGQRFSVSFQRTLQIPQDDRVYPLPPGLLLAGQGGRGEAILRPVAKASELRLL